MSDDFYSILEIKKTATVDEIKKAYKKLALKWHPDKNKDANATEMFTKIGEAYNTLIDPEKRKIYDQFGKEGLNNHGMQFNPNDMFNIFKHAFGEQSPFGMPNMFQQNNQPIRHIEIQEKITLRDVYTGKKTHVNFSRDSNCPSCNGIGSDDGVDRVCKTCNGRKLVQQQTRMGMMISISTIPCPTCHGSGSDNGSHVCKKCSGNKIIKENYHVDVEIPIGCSDGEIISFDNIGNYDINSKKRSNVYIRIAIEQNDKFIRNAVIDGKIRIDGADLLTQITISFAESLCGFSRNIELIDGSSISFSVSDIIKHGDLYSIAGKGMPIKNTSHFGNLHIMFQVDYISSLSDDKKKLLWKLLTDNEYPSKGLTHNNNVILSKFNPHIENNSSHNKQHLPQDAQCAQQ